MTHQDRKSKRGNDMVLQPDDLQILRLLSKEFLLLTSEQIYQLFPTRPPRALNRRLANMVRRGFLHLRYPGTFVAAAPRRLYYVTPKAAEALPATSSADQLRFRSRRARDFTDTDLPHLTFANFVQIKFHIAASTYPDYQLQKWIPQYSSLWSNLATSHFSVQPDGFAKLQKAGRTFLYFIEVDRSTYRGKHLDKRLSFYANYAFASHNPPDFKHPRFRVLFITETGRRATELLTRLRNHHPDLFWVASWNEFSSHPLFHPYWRTCASSRLHALDDPYVLPSLLPYPPSPSSPIDSGDDHTDIKYTFTRNAT